MAVHFSKIFSAFFRQVLKFPHDFSNIFSDYFHNLWSLPQKHSYHPKPQFYRRRFLKFNRLILVPKVLVGSENWLVCLSYDQESIRNVVNFFGVLMCSNMKEIRCLTMSHLHVWMLPQENGYPPKTNFFIYFVWTLVDSFYNSYSLFISLGNTVKKYIMHLRS